MRRSIAAALAALMMFQHLAAGAEPAKSVSLPAGYVDEAPLPEGFPPPSEVGRVVEKSYPLLRSYSAQGDRAFMQCFGYLSKHKHAMTAPVVVQTDPGAAAGAATQDLPVPVKQMHFLLEKLSQDEPKQEGSVLVADMPMTKVLSIAHQGRLSPEVVWAAEGQLRAELARRTDFKQSGATRILGYNGPAVPADKVYWEIQIPVASADQGE